MADLASEALPRFTTGDDPTDRLNEAMRRIEDRLDALTELSATPVLPILAAEPTQLAPVQGGVVLVYADGTNWDPGSGEGLYALTDSGWVAI